MTVTVFLRGGLGNQLFQYAAGLYLSRRQNEALVLRHDLLPQVWDSISGVPRCPVQLNRNRLDGSLICKTPQPTGKTHLLSKALQVQRILADMLPQIFLKIGILAGEVRSAPDFHSLKRIRVVNAYCTSSIPAEALGESLRIQIRDIINPSVKFIELMEQASRTSPIVVHIRLGDYLKLSNLYGSTNYAAIGREISRVRKSESEPVWLFSDSPSDLPLGIEQSLGVSKVIGPNELESPIENLALMAAGSHFIAANSTFSWWAAFLKGEGNHVSFPLSSGSLHNIFSADMPLEGWRAYSSN